MKCRALPLSLIGALALATLAAGCRKRQQAPPAEAAGTAAAAPVEAPPAAAPSPAATGPRSNVPGAVDLTPVQQAIDRFWKERKHTPYTLQDLVRAGYLKALPTPPSGKQLHYDNERATVSLVDR
jgi:hypothetical protein